MDNGCDSKVGQFINDMAWIATAASLFEAVGTTLRLRSGSIPSRPTKPRGTRVYPPSPDLGIVAYVPYV